MLVSIQKLFFGKNIKNLQFHSILFPYKKCVNDERYIRKQIEIPSLLTVFLTILLNKLHFMPAFAIMTIDRQRVAHCIPAAFSRPRSQPPKKAVFQAELGLDHRLLQICKLTCKFKLDQQMALEFFFKNFFRKSRWPPLCCFFGRVRPQLEAAADRLFFFQIHYHIG